MNDIDNQDRHLVKLIQSGAAWTNDYLKKLRETDKHSCTACGQTGTLEHIPRTCQQHQVLRMQSNAHPPQINPGLLAMAIKQSIALTRCESSTTTYWGATRAPTRPAFPRPSEQTAPATALFLPNKCSHTMPHKRIKANALPHQSSNQPSGPRNPHPHQPH